MLDQGAAPDLAGIAENERASLDPDFFEYRDHIEHSLALADYPSEVRFRSLETNGFGAKLAAAALEELTLLLCTNDRRYAEVRARAGNFSNTVLPAVAGYVSATVGVSVAIAGAGVAFVALAILRVGVGSLCRAVKKERGPSSSDR